MFGVSRKVIPKVLEVDSFTGCYELEGCNAVVMKVPEISQQPNGRPIANAWHKRIHQNNPIDL